MIIYWCLNEGISWIPFKIKLENSKHQNENQNIAGTVSIVIWKYFTFKCYPQWIAEIWFTQSILYRLWSPKFGLLNQSLLPDWLTKTKWWRTDWIVTVIAFKLISFLSEGFVLRSLKCKIVYLHFIEFHFSLFVRFPNYLNGYILSEFCVLLANLGQIQNSD